MWPFLLPILFWCAMVRGSSRSEPMPPESQMSFLEGFILVLMFPLVIIFFLCILMIQNHFLFHPEDLKYISLTWLAQQPMEYPQTTQAILASVVCLMGRRFIVNMLFGRLTPDAHLHLLWHISRLTCLMLIFPVMSLYYLAPVLSNITYWWYAVVSMTFFGLEIPLVFGDVIYQHSMRRQTAESGVA